MNDVRITITITLSWCDDHGICILYIMIHYDVMSCHVRMIQYVLELHQSTKHCTV